MIDKTSYINEITKIEKKQDGSYIVMRNNMAYHIPNNDEYRLEYNMVDEYVKENNIQVSLYSHNLYKIVDDNAEEYIRNKRDMLLNKADILLIKYNEQVSLGIINENKEYYNALLQYKQNLRDITKQIDFPNNIIFPIMPEYF